MKMNRRTFSATLVAGATASLIAKRTVAATSAPVVARNVVLVHGLFADGSSWSEVIARLQARGLNVTSVQNPLTTLPEAVAAAQRVLDRQDGPTVLAGHSFSGAKFRFLAANVVEYSTGKTLFPPYAIKTFDGAKVACAYLQRPWQQQEVDMVGARLGASPTGRQLVPSHADARPVHGRVPGHGSDGGSWRCGCAHLRKHQHRVRRNSCECAALREQLPGAAPVAAPERI